MMILTVTLPNHKEMIQEQGRRIQLNCLVTIYLAWHKALIRPVIMVMNQVLLHLTVISIKKLTLQAITPRWRVRLLTKKMLWSNNLELSILRKIFLKLSRECWHQIMLEATRRTQNQLKVIWTQPIMEHRVDKDSIFQLMIKKRK